MANPAPILPTRVLNNVAVFNIRANVWSCAREVRPSDLKIDEGTLPSKKIRSRSMGRRYVFDREKLRPFHECVNEAKGILMTAGFLDAIGYIVPAGAEQKCAEQLKAVDARVAQLKQDFSDHYYDWRDQYVAACLADPENAGFEEFIQAGLLSRADAMERTDFRWSCHRIAPPDAEDTAAVESYNSLKESLALSLARDIARIAATAFSDDLLGRRQATRGILSPFKKILEKLESLAPLMPEAYPVIDMIHEAAATLPQKGPIEGPSLMAFKWLIHMLSDVGRLRYYGGRILEGERTARNLVEEGMKASDDDELLGLTQPLDLQRREEPVTVDATPQIVVPPKARRVVNI